LKQTSSRKKFFFLALPEDWQVDCQIVDLVWFQKFRATFCFLVFGLEVLASSDAQ
jgi:hypothetical protein